MTLLTDIIDLTIEDKEFRVSFSMEIIAIFSVILRRFFLLSLPQVFDFCLSLIIPQGMRVSSTFFPGFAGGSPGRRPATARGKL